MSDRNQHSLHAVGIAPTKSTCIHIRNLEERRRPWITGTAFTEEHLCQVPAVGIGVDQLGVLPDNDDITWLDIQKCRPKR